MFTEDLVMRVGALERNGGSSMFESYYCPRQGHSWALHRGYYRLEDVMASNLPKERTAELKKQLLQRFDELREAVSHPTAYRCHGCQVQFEKTHVQPSRAGL